jgi:hypothetical protein
MVSCKGRGLELPRASLGMISILRVQQAFSFEREGVLQPNLQYARPLGNTMVHVLHQNEWYSYMNCVCGIHYRHHISILLRHC